MKLNLNRKWFEDRISVEDNCEVGAGAAPEGLAAEARISAADLLNIEVDPKYIPSPRAVHQLAEYFHIPQRSLLRLANVTDVHNDRLRDAAVRFAASSSQVIQLSREERAALTEFVDFLSSQAAD